MSFTSRYKTRECVFVVDLHDTAGKTRGALDEQSQALVELCISSWLALLQDSPLNNTSGLKPVSLFKRFISEFEHSVITDVIRRYCGLGDKLLMSQSEGGITPTFIPEMKNTPIYKEYLYWYKTTDPVVERYLLSFLFFAKKTEFRSPDFNATAFRSWLGVEERLSKLTLPDFVDDIAKIIDAVLPTEFQAPSFMGKHGSGAVSDKARGDIEKSVNFKMYPKLVRFIGSFAPHNMRNVNGPVDVTYLVRWHLEKSVQLAKSVSKLMFVPKNFKTARSICMEPISIMYFQQHLRWELENMISESLFSNFVKIGDQTWNQQGALYGSRDRNVDTIDLSAASDSVSLKLVRRIFPRRLLHGLLSTRSDLVKTPDGKTIPMHKFAPMGSALCFPVQSIIYAAVVVYAYMLWHNRPYMDRYLESHSAIRHFIQHQIPTTWEFGPRMESIAVYGDDIICDSRVTGIVIGLLEELGFEVNVSKSFMGANRVRESCGVFARDGKDVTPFTFKCKHYDGNTIEAEFLSSIISLINRSGDFGYKALRSHLINYLKRQVPPHAGKVAPILFTTDRESTLGVFSTNPRNTHLKKRVNKGFQRDEVRTWVITYSDVIVTPTRRTLPSNTKVVPPQSREAWDRYSIDMFYRAAVQRANTNDENFVTPRKVLKGARVSVAWVAGI